MGVSQLRCVSMIPEKLLLPVMFALTGIGLIAGYWNRYISCGRPINIWILVNLLMILFSVARQCGWTVMIVRHIMVRTIFMIFDVSFRIFFMVWNIVGVSWFKSYGSCLKHPDYWIVFVWFFLWTIGFIVDGYFFVKTTCIPIFRFYLPKYMRKHWWRKSGLHFEPVPSEEKDEFGIELTNNDNPEASLFRLPTSPLYEESDKVFLGERKI